MKVRFHASKSTASVLLMFSSVNFQPLGDFPADMVRPAQFANNNIGRSFVPLFIQVNSALEKVLAARELFISKTKKDEANHAPKRTAVIIMAHEKKDSASRERDKNPVNDLVDRLERETLETFLKKIIV